MFKGEEAEIGSSTEPGHLCGTREGGPGERRKTREVKEERR